ncbi:AMP-binding protein [Williamsia sp. 1135]|uniref:(2,3-dihydroxybenzoyl)adenylate synthase n=1 Tax=Williamsia sp. 1135 TaxID=1889262 RepID=UPI000A10DAA8|nr:AMP-binding protein [Williamsia sp. 1135]ORM26892.1 2,3-dihydroxybenzoate-AMP ligase [Williamsia sp. 1135]
MPDVIAFGDLTSGFADHPGPAAARYRDLGLWLDLPLWRVLWDQADARPLADAVSDADRTLTYREFVAAAQARAAGFLDAGLRPGDRVILQNQNSVEFAVNLFGLLRGGMAPVMTLPAHRINEIAHLAHTAGAVGYICHDASKDFDYRGLARDLVTRAPAVQSIFVTGDPAEFSPMPDGDPESLRDVPAPDPDAPALFLVSGGTTGLPKLIARTHNDYRFNAQRSAEIAALTSRDTYLVALPAAHNFPLACPGLLGVLSVGGHTVFTDNPSPDNTFDLIEKHHVTVVALVPALAQVWTAATEWEPADISSLRLLQVGGAKLAEPDAIAANAVFGGAVQQVFGMAEGLICYTRADDDNEIVTRTQGRPMSDLDDVRIVDDNGVDVADGSEGELLVRGPYTIRGYYRADEHNARSFTGDGYYRSGDRVRRLPSGHLMVTGRIKDTIVRGGENVAADDVEENLLAHPDIRQAAVVGLPDPGLGEKICAAIVTDGPAPDLPAVRAFLADRGLATFKQPDQLRVVRSLPVTAVGKIDKRTLVAQLT